MVSQSMTWDPVWYSNRVKSTLMSKGLWIRMDGCFLWKLIDVWGRLEFVSDRLEFVSDRALLWFSPPVQAVVMGPMGLDSSPDCEARLISAAGYVSSITPCKVSKRVKFNYYHHSWEVQNNWGAWLFMGISQIEGRLWASWLGPASNIRIRILLESDQIVN